MQPDCHLSSLPVLSLVSDLLQAYLSERHSEVGRHTRFILLSSHGTSEFCVIVLVFVKGLLRILSNSHERNLWHDQSNRWCSIKLLLATQVVYGNPQKLEPRLGIRNQHYLIAVRWGESFSYLFMTVCTDNELSPTIAFFDVRGLAHKSPITSRMVDPESKNKSKSP